MTLLWLRRIETRVAGLTIVDPKQEVSIKKEISSTPAIGFVSIYNLSDDHQRQIEDRGESLVISAGYGDDVAVLFDGTAQKVEREWSGAARMTKVALGGRAVSKEIQGGITIRSYDEPTSLRQIARDIVDDMGLEIGSLAAIPADEKRPWEWGASAVGALNLLASGSDFWWFEDDGVIRFNKTGTADDAADVVKLTPATGLLQSPTKTDEGARVTCLLQTRAALGGIVELESRVLGGRWKIVSLLHEGDNWTSSFTTELDLRPL